MSMIMDDQLYAAGCAPFVAFVHQVGYQPGPDGGHNGGKPGQRPNDAPCGDNMCELPDFEENIKVPLEKQAITLIDAWGQRYDVKINKVTTDFKEALEDVEYIMMPIPAIGCKSFFSAVIPHLKDGQTIVKWSAFLPSPLQRCSKTKASRRTSTSPKVIPSRGAVGS